MKTEMEERNEDGCEQMGGEPGPELGEAGFMGGAGGNRRNGNVGRGGGRRCGTGSMCVR
jgi:hypothetical protein